MAVYLVVATWHRVAMFAAVRFEWAGLPRAARAIYYGAGCHSRIRARISERGA